MSTYTNWGGGARQLRCQGFESFLHTLIDGVKENLLRKMLKNMQNRNSGEAQDCTFQHSRTEPGRIVRLECSKRQRSFAYIFCIIFEVKFQLAYAESLHFLGVAFVAPPRDSFFKFIKSYFKKVDNLNVQHRLILLFDFLCLNRLNTAITSAYINRY